MAYKLVNFSPLRNKVAPRFIFRRLATTSSMRSNSVGLRPKGMHNSRKLQLEQATLMLCEFISITLVASLMAIDGCDSSDWVAFILFSSNLVA
jgi:hypothetical protein